MHDKLASGAGSAFAFATGFVPQQYLLDQILHIFGKECVDVLWVCRYPIRILVGTLPCGRLEISRALGPAVFELADSLEGRVVSLGTTSHTCIKDIAGCPNIFARSLDELNATNGVEELIHLFPVQLRVPETPLPLTSCCRLRERGPHVWEATGSITHLAAPIPPIPLRNQL